MKRQVVVLSMTPAEARALANLMAQHLEDVRAAARPAAVPGRTERELAQLVPVWERLWLAVTSLPP